MPFEILTPGLLTLVIDYGRTGYRRYGIPTSGAMDSFAFRVANILTGNEAGSAALEVNLAAPEILFMSDTVIAVTGAEFSPEINGIPIPMWESILVKNGSILSFSAVKSGCRAYIAFAGGVDVPVVMGSRSTFIRAEIGGFKGRALKMGDVINTAAPTQPLLSLVGRRVDSSCVPVYSGNSTIRVIMGPQDDYFTSQGIKTFLSSPYTVSSQYDRMGYRLEGPLIEAKSGSDIISEGIVVGSVQIPGDGKPIIIMEDGQTAGGYAKIATVLMPDLCKVAQAKSGDSLHFEVVSINEAHRIFMQMESEIKNIQRECTKLYRKLKYFRILCNGKHYDVAVEEFK